MQNGAPYEVSWNENIHEDFLKYGLTELHVLKIKSKMEDYVAHNPFYHSDRIKGFDNSIRKVKFGRNYRLFIFVQRIMNIIYCLAFLPRKNCYDKVSLNKILTLVRNISKE